MFKKFCGMFSNDLAIDLGTANVLVLSKTQEVLVNEPSIVAIQYDKYGKEQVLAVGQEAKEMVGKTPGNIKATRPMKDGVIADFQTTEMMIRYFIEKAHNRKLFCYPRVVICVPYDLTRVEKHAVKDATLRAGARYVHLIEEPMAAAIGAGLPVKEPNGNLIVDIGGGTTEIGITSLGGLVSSLSVRVGGDKIDQAIIDYIKKNFNLIIGERAAETLKIEIGTAIKLDKALKKTVSGRNSVDGSIASIEVTSEHMRAAMIDSLQEIANALKSVLEATPPDLAGDIVQNGIVLSGGGALIRGLDVYLSQIVKIPVYVAEDPLLAVARGTGKVLQELDMLQKVCLDEE
ncbi:MAG: hypothetical protein RL113_161 [Pseudomonadota bacterium]